MSLHGTETGVSIEVELIDFLLLAADGTSTNKARKLVITCYLFIIVTPEQFGTLNIQV